MNLSYNGLGIDAAESLSQALVENDTLKELDLTGTRLSDQAVIVIARGLETNECLEKLVVSSYLHKNQFTCMKS